MSDRLKKAVLSVEAPAYLESRIRANLHAAQDKPQRAFWTQPWAAVAAVVVLCVGGAVAYQLGSLRLTAGSQESYIATVSSQVGTLMRVGLGDHIHCAVFRKYPKNPPRIEDLEREMGPEFAGLIPVVRSRVSQDYRLMMAHQCRYHGRKFVHLSFQTDSRILSVVVTNKGEGESFDAEQLVPALAQAGIPIYQAGVQRFQLAAFESKSHLVYMISDLSRDQNLEMMATVAPQMKAYLKTLEL
ncbi:MAG: hypothetical protein ABI823_11815 [Bryobacteraceae bacterium]